MIWFRYLFEPAFLCRIYLKLGNIPPVTSKLVKKVIRNLGPSKASGPDSIPVVVCDLELSYILVWV